MEPVLVARCLDLAFGWPLAVPHLQKALDRQQRYDLKSILDLVVEDKAQLWLACSEGKITAACVTQIAEYPAKIMLLILLLGGTGMKDFISPLIEVLKRFASESRCNGIELHGRPGWSRVLAPYGMRQYATSLEIMNGPSLGANANTSTAILNS